MNSGFSLNRLHSIEAKLEQLHFIEKNYPKLKKNACAEVIYACNFCLKEMAKVDYYNEEIEKEMQVLYKKYTDQYLKANNVSIQGKIIAMVAFIDTKIARKILRKLA